MFHYTTIGEGICRLFNFFVYVYILWDILLFSFILLNFKTLYTQMKILDKLSIKYICYLHSFISFFFYLLHACHLFLLPVG